VQFTIQGATTQTDSPFIIEESGGAEEFTVDDGGLVSSLVGYDVIGNVDMDLGSADVDDITLLTDGGTVVIDGTITMDAGLTLFMGGLLDATGNVDMDYGSADIDDHTFTTDGTGTAEIVLPTGSIDSTEILDDTIANADMADNSIDSDDYVDGSIDLAHMSSASVDSDNIVDNTIANSDMADNSIDSDDYVDASIDLAHMSSASVDSDNIVDATIVEADLDGDVAPADGDFLQFDSTGANFTWRSATETTSDLSLVIGTNTQAWDAELDTIAALTETNGAVMFVAGGAWTADTSPAMDCSDCTSVPATAWSSIGDPTGAS